MANNLNAEQTGTSRRANRKLLAATWIVAGVLLLLAIVSYVFIQTQKPAPAPGASPDVPASGQKK